ncbi:MAG: 23S rRNA (pseudouridine(1915)-N(3))-methyltransferase RlmH [Oscillospiraceae bacterium]|jgi:23S rRNA (pseudouridine1915-N3)-methyltransferase|nr:23S rRNA (pseudouridine(1915)-N(3))-methyltransferase RlmH [Oscillospiraceae bacterium]
MFSVTLLTVGKLKEAFYAQAVAEYRKRLGAYCKCTVTELVEARLPENANEKEIQAGLSKEALLIRARIPKGAWLCVLTPEGELLSSEAFAQTLQAVKHSGKSHACFLIGSSHGIDAGIKAQADLRLSFGRMTFPHHLMRVMALEQIYRAETIQAGTHYHK